MRLDIYEGVLFYIMKGIKPNYAELGRQYHCDPRTVKNQKSLTKILLELTEKEVEYQAEQKFKHTKISCEEIYDDRFLHS